MTWLQGRGDIVYRSQKPLRLRGDVTVAPDGFAIDAMKAEIDGGAVEGRVAVSHRDANKGSKIAAELKAERLDLDAAAAFARSLAGPQAEWPDEGHLSLDIGRAISAGQELRPLVARFGYDAKAFALDQLNIGQPDKVALEAVGRFDRTASIGKLELSSTAASLDRASRAYCTICAIACRAAQWAGNEPRCRAHETGARSGPTKARTGGPDAQAVLDLDAPQLKGGVTMTATPLRAALRSMDVEALSRSEVGIQANLSAVQGRSLLALAGLDRVIAAGEGPAQFEGSLTGAWRAPLRLKAKMSGTGLDADVEGSAEPWAQEAKAGVNLKVRSADFGPLLDLKPTDTLARNIGLSSRVSLTGNKISLDDLDSSIAGSRLRGHLAVTLGEEGKKHRR